MSTDAKEYYDNEPLPLVWDRESIVGLITGIKSEVDGMTFTKEIKLFGLTIYKNSFRVDFPTHYCSG